MKQEKQLFKRNLKFCMVGIFLVLLIVVGIYLYITKNDSWECVQTKCVEYMTESEIESNVCNQTSNGLFCQLNVDGQVAEVPRNDLNFSSLQFCKKEICVKEAKIRLIN